MSSKSQTPGYYVSVILSWVFLCMGITFSGAGKMQPNQLGVVLAWTFSVIGLALSVHAVSISRHRGPMRVAEPLVTLAAFGFSAAVAVPVLIGAQAASKNSSCLSNAKQIVVAASLYLSDNNDYYPPSNSWEDKVLRYARTPETLKCPTASTPYSYAMNSALSGKSVSVVNDPATTVLAFECEAGSPNPSGGEESFFPRHDGIGSVGFVDGHAQRVKAGKKDIRWKP